MPLQRRNIVCSANPGFFNTSSVVDTASMDSSTYLRGKELTIPLDLAEEFVRRDQLKTLGAIIGCDAAVFTAGKIRKFMEIDPQHHPENRLWRSYAPLRRGLKSLSEQGFITKISGSKRIFYEVESWKKLEDYYHELLWILWCPIEESPRR